MDEPYLKEWGWQCCLRESSEENNYQPMELYRWLYRCMKDGLKISKRSIKVGDDVEEFDVAVSKKLKEGCADIYTSDEVYAHIRSIFPNDNGATSNKVVKIVADRKVEIMRIPVLQFGITDASVLLRAVCRVMEDNPTLCFPFTPRKTGSLPAIQDENGVYRYLYSVMPKEAARDIMKECYEKRVGEIEQALGEGFSQGKNLSLTQKKQVLKCIHDYIINRAEVFKAENNKSSTETETQEVNYMYYTRPQNGYLLPLMYCVLNENLEGDGLKGNCMSYTQALNYLARRYDIEAIQALGPAEGDFDNSGSIEDDEKDAHAWSVVRLSDEPYGSYPSDPSKWSSIDTYWDEPSHSGNTNDSVQWDYFLNTENIYPEEDTERYQREHREIAITDGYGNYPFVRSDGKILTPSFNCPYDSTEY